MSKGPEALVGKQFVDMTLKVFTQSLHTLMWFGDPSCGPAAEKLSKAAEEGKVDAKYILISVIILPSSKTNGRGLHQTPGKLGGFRRAEAIGINSSLLALQRVISARVESKDHVPYRDSKLTLILKQALMVCVGFSYIRKEAIDAGNSRTTAIVTCRSDESHGDQTLSSIRFGQMAATSVESARNTVLGAIRRCRQQMHQMEIRGNQHLPVYHTLKIRLQELELKAKELNV
eukprot:jgi/Bigna1/140648/aug1.57_g15356